MSEEQYIIRVNQFTDGMTGHVNITFIGGGINVTYGSNVSPSSGVQVEFNNSRIAANPGAYSFTDILVGRQQFDQALTFARTADALHNSYFGLSNNCVDFGNAVLGQLGLGEYAMADFLREGTLTQIYANTVEALRTSPFMSPAETAVVNVLLSASNLADAVAFAESLSWLSHPTGDPFYSDYFDPDEIANWHLNRLKVLGQKLGIDVEKIEDLENHVMLGVASPIAIDLNGDGLVSTDYFTKTVSFDIDGDGHTDTTAWISGLDGFLAFDRNSNGAIDNVSELFGGTSRGHGFAKLAAFDDDGNGRINGLDDIFSKLKIWRDANCDGISEASELHALSAFGISELDLRYQSSETRINGNLYGEISSATVFGQAQEMTDIYFLYKKGHAVTELDEQAATVELIGNANNFQGGEFGPSAMDI